MRQCWNTQIVVVERQVGATWTLLGESLGVPEDRQAKKRKGRGRIVWSFLRIHGGGRGR
jgi:hypothetical protein